MRHIIHVSFGAYVIKILYVVVAIALIIPNLPEASKPVTAASNKNLNAIELSFIIDIIPIVFKEELFFRILPVLVLFQYTSNKWLFLIVGVISAVYFGYSHGHTIGGVLVQGVGSLVMFWLTYYLGRRYYVEGYGVTRIIPLMIAPFLVHLAFNATMVGYIMHVR